MLHHYSSRAINEKNKYYLDGEEIQSTIEQKDLGLIVDGQLTFHTHHKKTAAKLAAATSKVLSILRGACYSVRSFVWERYLRPIALNGALLARTDKRKLIDLYNKPFLKLFSKCKPKQDMKIATPVEFPGVSVILSGYLSYGQTSIKNFLSVVIS